MTRRTPITPERLRAFRKRYKLTQAQAARWYGCGERAWQRYEAPRGTAEARPVPLPLQKRIAAGEHP